VLAGVSLTLLPFVPTVHLKLAAITFGAEKVSEEIKFLIAVFGPTVASWGVLFYALVKTYFRNPTRGTWWALVMSIVVWAPMDSALSFHYGLYPAVALNAAVAGLFLGLLFSVRHQAFTHPTTPHASRPAQS
jgi:membrane associated rhomboid family serine protease